MCPGKEKLTTPEMLEDQKKKPRHNKQKTEKLSKEFYKCLG